MRLKAIRAIGAVAVFAAMMAFAGAPTTNGASMLRPVQTSRPKPNGQDPKNPPNDPAGPPANDPAIHQGMTTILLVHLRALPILQAIHRRVPAPRIPTDRMDRTALMVPTARPIPVTPAGMVEINSCQRPAE